MSKPHEILKKYWAYDTFRQDQEKIILSILSGKNTLALMPTGGGKSLCYQVPALCLEGVCLVVSPLIALMQDQTEALLKRGIPAAMMHSGYSMQESQEIQHKLLAGKIKILYLSPEKLLFSKSWLTQIPWSFVAVDEAHCISQWGFDFRPAYLKIYEFLEKINVPVIALTATATKQVREDIITHLKMKDVQVFQSSFKRENISISVISTENKSHSLLHILDKIKKPALIYVRNRRQTVSTARFLQEHHHSADHYHAGLSAIERAEKFRAWLIDQTRIICCTNAFGMGVDKSDVGLVVHLDLPSQLEEYFQEAGRAGRGGDRSWAVVLYNAKDSKNLIQKLKSSFPPDELINQVWNSLKNLFKNNENRSIHSFDFKLFSQNFKFEPSIVYACLKCLGIDGQISLGEGLMTRSKIQILASTESIYSHFEKRGSPEKINWLKLILRTHEGITDVATKLNDEFIANTVGIGQIDLHQFFEELNQLGFIHYQPASDDQSLFILSNLDLALNLSGLKLYRERMLSKCLEMLKWIETKECRQTFILKYFGESKTIDCGICDNCLAKKSYNDPGKLRQSMKEKIMREIALRKSCHSSDILHLFPMNRRDLVEYILIELLGENKIERKLEQLSIKK
ncbi:MAG: RecQ family ATP-dependent DNA helicase [Saprospiraceae bacterium]|nr:RecQ family ATP-dependent DNA helicase [Saprospiraceae bacterium]